MENITGNEFDCSSEETEVFIIVTNLIKQMQTTCIMALVVVHVALERYYSRHESRFTEPNPYQEQIDHINRLVRRSDTTCVEQLRMDRNCFMRLCILVQIVGGLSHSRSVCLEEKVAMFLYTIGHYHKNRVVKHQFLRSGQTVSRHFNDVLRAVLRLQDRLLVKPEPITQACTDERWNIFQVSETLMAGLSSFADKLVSSLETSNATLEKLGGRMGYAHDLSAKRGEVNEELAKLPISTVDRVKAGLGITKDAQTVDHFFSLKTEEEKLILVQTILDCGF